MRVNPLSYGFIPDKNKRNEERKMAVNIEKILKDKRTELEEQVSAYNAAVKKNNFTAMAKAEADAKEVCKAYTDAKTAQVFNRIMKEENPLKVAATENRFTTLSVRTLREDGFVTGMAIVEEDDEKAKEVQIDLLKLCEKLGVDTMWKYDIARFHTLLVYRNAKDLNISPDEMKKINDSNNMREFIKSAQKGEDPASNKAIDRELQKILDKILYEDKNGKNAHLVNSHDRAYLDKCFTKAGRKALSVTSIKPQGTFNLIYNILHRIVADKMYSLDFKIVEKVKASNTVVKSGTRIDCKTLEVLPAEKKPRKSTKTSKASDAKVEEAVVEVSKNETNEVKKSA